MKPWFELAGPEREAVLSSSVLLSRNLEGVPFPPVLDSSRKKNVLGKAREAILGEKSLLAGSFHLVSMSSLSGTEAVALAERGVILPSFLGEEKSRGLFLSEDESQSVMVNGEDHFLLQVRTSGLSLRETYHKADRLDTILDKSLHFAFDKRLGYLTRNPALLGTGMVVSMDLHLPALTETGAAVRISADLRPLGILLRGIPGVSMGLCGSVYRLSNRMTLGITEQEAVTNLCGIAGQLIAQERAERNKLIRDLSVQDMVGRSLGIFSSARLLNYREFLRLASVVRFGIAAGFLNSISFEKIDSLLMYAQPANLSLRAGHKLSPDEERAARAELVRNTFVRK